MKRVDRKRVIKFVEISEAAPAECPITKAQLLARFHAHENGRLLSGARAFAAVWRAIPVLRPLGLLARLPGVLELLEKAYVAFLNVRPKLQQLTSGDKG